MHCLLDGVRKFQPGVPLYFIKALHLGNPAVVIPLMLGVPPPVIRQRYLAKGGGDRNSSICYEMYVCIYLYKYINRLLLVEVKNVLIQIYFIAKSTSTSRSEKCVDSNRFHCKIDFY